jgi:2-oxoglutarate dehydrogenase E1 component
MGRSDGSDDPRQLLARVPLFRDATSEDLERVAALAHEQRFEKGDLICRRGEEGRDLFIITHGTVVVRQGERLVATLQAGQVVGELAVLDSRPRSADVVAASAVRLLRIGGEDFQRALERSSGLARGLLRVLASRVRDTSSRQMRVDQLVRAHRERGHVLAQLDPLGFRTPSTHPELEPEHHGLSNEDLDERFSVQLGAEAVTRPLREILQHLRETYCGFTGVQYMHVDDLRVQAWLRERLEDRAHRRELDPDEQRRLLAKLTDAEVLETFLHEKFVGAKRFSLEGAETLIPLLDTAVNEAARHGVRQVVIGMAHRGRLNVLANILGKPAARIFREFQDLAEDAGEGGGDVKYHLGFESSRIVPSGETVELSLLVNPSHLELVGTVVLGRARALQEERGDPTGAQVLPIIVHGDAAFAGQGVVQELFNLGGLPGYATGGALHVIVNNQIGFTTPPEESRSCPYATDVARMLQVPIFHVNGERPEAAHRVLQLALEFRATFHGDVVVDMYCYRRHGHNENDDTAFTQPLMAACIREREPMRVTFARNVVALGAITEAEADEIARSSRSRLEEQLEESRRVEDPTLAPSRSRGRWAGFLGGPSSDAPEADTTVPEEQLVSLLRKTVELPSGFAAHRMVERLAKARLDMARGERPVDWSAAEALAFATLVTEGHPVRLSGQDSQRGTFGHRHAVLHDQRTGATCCPLAQLERDQAPFRVFNSPLSEVAVLGFDWGYSLERPDGLTIWEAQFGDFANVAQVVFDQLLSSAEQKWRLLSGLAVFLPHGFEGQGPDHSSARLERVLALCARDNLQVVSPSTASQLFHCLRRQVKRRWRKPLILLSPKGLLRHPAAASALSELATGRFRGVLSDPDRPLPQASRVLLCSGKIAHELARERGGRDGENASLVRIEQLHPLPEVELRAVLARAPAGCPFAWVQEEPENMGAWPHLRIRLPALLPSGAELQVVARPESASPATGSKARHELEQADLLRRAFAATGLG